MRHGRYDFRELLGIYRAQVRPAVRGAPGVVMTDIDERQNRIVVGVSSPERMAGVRSRLDALQLSADLFDVVQFDEITQDTGEPLSALATSYPYTLFSTFSSVPAATHIKVYFVNQGQQYYKPCGLGFNLVAWQGSTTKAERYFVTNSHCTGQRGVVNTNPAYQGDAGGYFASEIVDPPWHDYTYNWVCTPGLKCRFSDAALFRYVNPSKAWHGAVAYTQLNSIAVTSYRTVTEVTIPVAGYRVHKIGPTTGHTTALVSHACADLYVHEAGAWLLCQGMAPYGSYTGDSGSPVVELTSSTALAIGLHWGWNRTHGLFSPMYAVLNELYESWAPWERGILDPTAPLPAPPQGPSGPPIVGPNYLDHLQPGSWSWSGGTKGCTWTINGEVVKTGSCDYSTTGLPGPAGIVLGVEAGFSEGGYPEIQFSVLIGGPSS